MSYVELTGAESIQGSNEWLEFRKNHITATDVAVIMGLSPWKTPIQLWKEKLGLIEPEVSNKSMLEGQRLEPIARDKFNQIMNSNCQPIVAISESFPFMMASIDGLDKDLNILVEIKCSKKIYDHAFKGIVPEYYFAQMQAQMFVTGVNLCHYFAFDGEHYAQKQVAIDDDFIKEMLEKSKIFYECVKNFDYIPLEKHIERNDEEWKSLCAVVNNCREKIKFYEQSLEQAKRELIQLCGGSNARGGGITLSKVVQPGRIDYSAIPELSFVDLEKYRKPASEYWKIS